MLEQSKTMRSHKQRGQVLTPDSSRNMLEGVIFDMDGVLVDSHPMHKRAWRQLLTSVGREVTDADLEFVTRGTKREEILRHFLGDLTREQIEDLGQRKQELFEKEVADLRPIRGLEPFLVTLERAGIPKVVVTTAARARTDLTLAVLGLSHRFTTVFTGDDLPNGKSDARIFTRTSESLGIQPQHLLVIEDSGLGIMAAKATGMKCLGIAQGEKAGDLRLAGADHVVPDYGGLRLSDLRRLFR